MNKHKTFLFGFIVLFSFFLVIACDDGNNDSNDELTFEQCHEISEDCEAFAKVESWEYECTLAEPETQGCLIEKKGFYYQTFHACEKSKMKNKCSGAVFWTKKCLADCYYNKLDYATYEQAEKECMDKCMYEVDY